MQFPQAQLTDRNRLTGYAVWSLLTAVIDYHRGGIDPQLDLAPDAEQAVTLEWDLDRPEDMPIDYLQWEVRVTINPELSPTDHKADLIETTADAEADLLTIQHYSLTVRQLLVALPWIERREFSKIRGLINATDCEEYDLKAMSEAMAGANAESEIKEKIISDLSDLHTKMVLTMLQQDCPMSTPVTGTDKTLGELCQIAGISEDEIRELQKQTD